MNKDYPHNKHTRLCGDHMKDLHPGHHSRENCHLCAALLKLEQLQKAIREHRDQRLDDRCWLDDQKLYAVLGEDVLANNDMPPREKFLANCARFYERRCQGGDWLSYQEVERQRDEAVEAAKAYADLCTCYRMSKRPSQALHDRLDRAASIVAKGKG